MKPYSRAKSLHILDRQRWYVQHRSTIFFVLFLIALFGISLFAVSKGLRWMLIEEETNFAKWLSDQVIQAIPMIAVLALLLFGYFRPDLWFRAKLWISPRKLHPSTANEQTRWLRYYRQLANRGDPDEDPIRI